MTTSSASAAPEILSGPMARQAASPVRGKLANRNEPGVAGVPVSELRIAAGRFVLRPVRESDAGLIALHAGDRRVAEQTQNIPHPFPPGAAEAYVSRALRQERPGSVWVIDGAQAGLAEVLGVVSLKPMEVAEGRSGQSELACWIAPAFWNTGIASEAMRALIAANPLGDSTYFAEVFQDNPGSARVLTNAGFRYLGDAEAFSVARGAIVPTWTYTRKLDPAPRPRA